MSRKRQNEPECRPPSTSRPRGHGQRRPIERRMLIPMDIENPMASPGMALRLQTLQ